ncbi:hypothetical protein H5410_039372 [Solanum commersonii]|uniref:40S ribosomal protein S27-like n=1 Tax=Solanum commersonii TaxID=4109 RepID=A0A9J5YFW9_SOLCO|nr:hypothetical protein H5410_039372 [Solanum commersonii]
MAGEIHYFNATSGRIVRVEVEKNVKHNFNFKVQRSGKKVTTLYINRLHHKKEGTELRFFFLGATCNICYRTKASRQYGYSKDSNDTNLLHPPVELEKQKHKLMCLVQSPNSTFLNVKCQGCFQITTIFSHSQTMVTFPNCQQVLCQPTGGRTNFTEGCSFRVKEKGYDDLGLILARGAFKL